MGLSPRELLIDALAREYATFQAAPFPPEDWQLANGDDFARSAVAAPELAGLLAADTARAQAEEQVARVRGLAEAWEQRAEAYSAADDRDKVTELRQRAAALRRALDGEQ